MKEVAKDVVRKLRREAQQPQWRHSKTIRWTIGIVVTLAIAALFPRPNAQGLSTYSIGALWTSDDVISPFSFAIKKDPSQIKRELLRAREDLFPVYVPDSMARSKAVKRLTENINRLQAMLSAATTDTLKQVALADSVHEFGFSSDEWKALIAFQSGSRNGRGQQHSPLLEVQPTLVELLDEMESGGLIVKPTPASDSFSSSPTISLRTRTTEETLVPRKSLVTIDEAANRIDGEVQKRVHGPEPLVHALGKLVGSSLVPTVIFNADLTREGADELDRKVLRTEGIVKEGQLILTRGSVINAQSKNELQSLAEARIERGGTASQITRIIGTIGHAGVILLLVVLYLRFIRRRIYNDNAQLLLLGLILLFPAVLAYLSVGVHLSFPLEYLILIPVTSMLLTILFDSRTGFYGTVVAALIVAGIRGNDYSVALAGLAAGAFAAYTVRDLRSRSQLFQSIGYIFLGYLIAITALALERSTPLSETGYQLLAASMNSLISPVLTFAALFAVESIFDTMSDLKLTEFDTINHPLLRELALRAPGTYQHTMLVAQLSENAAAAIGANGLLAKVGAYFHDIGKLVEPSDFGENQSLEAGNVHASLTPEESAERIRKHVVEGIALARAHNLPEKLVEFIPMHHGTRRISFFYESAMQLSPGVVVNEELYKYPGPKPASKETAIVMLADASEAVARSVVQQNVEPSLETMELAIDRLVRERFDEGQLDDCDLTIRDLTIVRSIFARLLVGLHHTRISYPTPNVEGEAQRTKRPTDRQTADTRQKEPA